MQARTHGTKIPNTYFFLLITTISYGCNLTFLPSVSAKTPKDIQLQVGIVQRFGELIEDKVNIASNPGDSLKLSFVDANSQIKSLKTDRVTLQITAQTQSEPELQERLVLSDRGTFETAEDSAKQWQKLGIEVEVTQPGRWQVWAKRSVYNSPLVRRWLLQSLKANGYNLPYLDGSIVSQKPQITFSIKGVTYQLQQLEIATTKKIVQLVRGEDRQRVKIYPGNLKIQPNAYGTFTIVNEVPLEAYLRGVIPHEIGPEAPKNAVEAQTIIARTYALRNLRRFSADNYQLCATQHCQVYEGWTGTNSIADRAIASTKGIVLTYQNQLVDALYSSTTGGITAPFSDIWNGEERPYLKAIIDAPTQVWNLSRQNLANEESFRNFISMQTGFNETGRKVFRWRRENNLEELNKDLRDYLERIKSPLVNFTTIQKIEIVERSPSGRVLKTIVSTDKGSVELFKSENRSAFSSLASTLFYLEPLYNEDKTLKGYAFIGGGFGHGVGFSQFGSYNLAKLGWSAKRILSFYYPGTKIQPLTSLTANSQF